MVVFQDRKVNLGSAMKHAKIYLGKLCSHKILKLNFAMDVFQNVADIK